jgi:hypothetical protein
MPTPLVKKYAKEAGVTTKKAEKRWEEAKEKTPKGVDNKWAYTTSVFKKMMGENENKSNYVKTFEQFINEDYARVHPNPGMNVGGMGPIIIPEVGVYNSTGSGDIPASSPASTSDTELKKKTKKGVVPITYTKSKNKKS